MYDLTIIGNPLIELTEDDKASANNIRNLFGPCMTSVNTAMSLGIDNMVLILSAPAHLHDALHEWLGNGAAPEHYIIDAGSSRCDRVTVDVGGRKTQAMASLNVFRVQSIPSELLNAQAILVAPSFQETGPEFLRDIRTAFNARIFWNPQLYRIAGGCDIRIGLIEDDVHAVCPLAECACLTLKEYTLLTGQKDPLVAAELLVEWGTRVGIVTLGEKGAVMFDGRDFIITPQYDITSEHISDAEDAFIAAAAVSMLEDRDMVDVAAFASAVGNLVIGQHAAKWMLNGDLSRKADSIRSRIRIK